MSPFRQLWIKWKTLRLPWRKNFLVGEDLSGNTYWEFRDALNANRMRRIVKSRRNLPHSDVQISPQWHQWLRQTRPDPPTIQEQQTDLTRQIQLKENARLADERWAAKARYIEKPREMPRTTMGGNPEVQEGQETIVGGDAPKTEVSAKEGVRSAVEGNEQLAREQEQTEEGRAQRERKPVRVEDDPWEEERQRQKQAASNPSAGWQPEGWTPGARRR